MAIAHDFSYERPQDLATTLRLKNEYGSRASFLAGGTDLIVNIKEGMQKPELLIDVKDIQELRSMYWDGDTLFIGAGVTFSQLIESEDIKLHFPILHDAAATVASTGVRSRATLAGNICSAVPSMDSAPALLIYGAVVHCASLGGKRDIPAEKWFLAPRKTDLAEDELVLGISLVKPPENSEGIYVKLGRYGGEDLAQAGWAFQISPEYQYRIAHCALAPVPKRALVTEAYLEGKELTPEVIAEACTLVEKEISPITDIRSSKEYRIHLSKVMVKRGLLAVLDRLRGMEVKPQSLLGGLA